MCALADLSDDVNGGDLGSFLVVDLLHNASNPTGSSFEQDCTSGL